MKFGLLKSIVIIFCLLTWLALNTASAACFDKREPGMDWSGCKKTNKMLNESDFRQSRFDNTKFTGSNLVESSVKGARLVKTDINRV
jgi:uncharacterized protein YjbI with pentapeptide repeats